MSAADAPPAAVDRPASLRLARVHLRVGLLTLARAELEASAVRGELDEDALLDLAEVRWRTGDLVGGAEAATELLGRGREDPLALIVAAEAVAAAGRPGEARGLAGRAVAAAGGPLEPWFAGMPRSPIWPADGAAPPPADGESPGEEASRALQHGPVAAGLDSASGGVAGQAPASTAAAEAFAGGRAALAAGHAAAAALRLGVALRLEPAFAGSVLEALGDRASEPALALVAGDALRLLGRESEALEAFDRARRVAAAPDGAASAGEPADR